MNNNMYSSRPANLLFDLGNVIIDIDIPRTREGLTRLLRDPADFEPVLATIAKYECGLIGTDLFINQILGQARHGVQALDVIEVWNSMLIGLPTHRLEMLITLRKDYKVYLLSNTNELHLTWVHRYLEREHGVQDFEQAFFDKAFYSHLLKDRKPNPSIYQAVLREAGIAPEDTLFMDDMPENLVPAEALGFRTHLVREGEEVGQFLLEEGYWEGFVY